MRSTSTAKAAFARGLLPVSVQVRAAAKAVAASRWASPVGRIALFAAGILLLAVIGNSALAKSPKALAAVASPSVVTSTVDVGAAPAEPDSGAAQNAPGTPPSQPAGPAREPGAHASARATPDDPVLLNSASVDDFQRLPGVGPKRARAIFDLRAHIGKFRHVEDLLRVKGIGRNTLKKLRPLVRLDTALLAAAADAGAPAHDP